MEEIHKALDIKIQRSHETLLKTKCSSMDARMHLSITVELQSKIANRIQLIREDMQIKKQ